MTDAGPSPALLADHFRHHFVDPDLLYAVLLAQMADDLDAGGVVARICRGWERAPDADAVQLRLLAAIFRIVLRGEAPQLRPFYPCLGGAAPARDCWPLLRPVLEAHAEELHAALAVSPQTNEVGRSAALVVGLFEAVRRHGLHRLRLLEPGASAGLNLGVDRFRFVGPGWSHGPESSPLTIDTGAVGVRPQPFEIVERRGCDLEPIDAASREGAMRLTSFVWPWQLERHARLAAALGLAARHPVAVDRADAAGWLAGQLERDPGDGVLTVVWHSVTQQYWPPEVSDGVQEAVEHARSRIPLSYLTMEGSPVRSGAAVEIAVSGPRVTLDGHLIARCHHHGPPVLLV